MPSFREACPRRGPDPPLHLHSHANRKQDSSALAGPGQSAPSSAPMTQPGQPAPPPPPALSWQKPQLGALGGSQTGGRRGAPGCQTWRLQAGQLRFPGKEEGAVNSASWVLQGGSKGPMLSLSNPSSQKRLVDFPLAGSVPVGYLAPLCSFPAPAAPFPKDSRTLSRKPISQMPPGSARQGAELHALSQAQKPGVWGPARAWPRQSQVGWEPQASWASVSRLHKTVGRERDQRGEAS